MKNTRIGIYMRMSTHFYLEVADGISDEEFNKVINKLDEESFDSLDDYIEAMQDNGIYFKNYPDSTDIMNGVVDKATELECDDIVYGKEDR